MSISCVVLCWAVLIAAWKSAPVHCRVTISQVNTWACFWLDFRQSVFPFMQAVSIASHEKWCMWHRTWKAKQTLHNLDDWMTIKLIACCVVDVEQRRRRRHCHLSTTSFVRRKPTEEIDAANGQTDTQRKKQRFQRERESERWRRKKVTWKVCLCSNKHVNCIYTKYDGDLLLFFLSFFALSYWLNMSICLWCAYRRASTSPTASLPFFFLAERIISFGITNNNQTKLKIQFLILSFISILTVGFVVSMRTNKSIFQNQKKKTTWIRWQ